MADDSSGGGFTGFWDKLLGAPGGGEGSMLGSILGQNYLSTPSGQQTLTNLQAQGYLGQGDPSRGIVHQRIGLGALLQGIGVLGPSTPVTAAPQEMEAYQQGALQRAQTGLGMQRTMEEMHRSRLNNAIEIAKAGGGAIPFSDMTPEEEKALGGVSDLAEQSKQALIDQRQTMKQYREWMMGGGGKQPLTPAGIVTKYTKQAAESPGYQMLQKQYEELTKASDEETDKDKKYQIDLQRFAVQQQMGRHMQSLGAMAGNPTIGTMPNGEPISLGAAMASQGIGEPVNPLQAYGVTDPRQVSAAMQDPRLLEMIRHPQGTLGNIMGNVWDAGTAPFTSGLQALRQQPPGQ